MERTTEPGLWPEDLLMLRQTLQLLVVVTALSAAAASAFAQSDGAGDRDWTVKSSAARDARVVERYRQLLLRQPDNSVAYRGLVERLGRGPALGRFIEGVTADAHAQSGPEPWILLGHLLHDHARASESLAAYQMAVTVQPSSPAAHAALGTALLRAGQPSAASESFERALNLAADGGSRRALLRKLADAAALRGDQGAAADWLGRLVSERPRDYALRLEHGEALLRAQRFDQALVAYEAAHELAGNNGKRRAECLLDIGNIQRRLQDFAAAEQTYRRALALVGKASWMRREILARLVEVAREMASLGAIYEELVREWGKPTYHDAMTLAGLAEELRREEEVVRWLERAAALDPRAVEPRQRLIARFDHTEQAERVKRLYGEIARIRPRDHVRALERIEWLFLGAGEATSAVAELRALQLRHAGDVDVLVEIAQTWRRFGMPDAALAVHAELERTSPTAARHLDAYGQLLAALGRFDDAWVVWERLLAVESRSVATRLRVAELLSRHRQHGRAIELARSVVDDFPNHLDARQRLAGMYEAEEQWPAALREWETLFFEHGVDHAAGRVVAIARRTNFLGDRAIVPDDGLLERWEAAYARDGRPSTGLVLAKLHMAMTAGDRGLDLARTVAAANPAALPVAEHLAWIEACELVARDLGDREPLAAVEALVRVADAFGDRRAGAWQRAVELVLPLQDDRARDVVSRALAAVPNDARVHALAATFFANRGERAAAIEHLARAVALGLASHDAYFDLAFHLTEAGELDRARAVYLDLLRADWSGATATSAAFSAIDLCETDADLFEVEAAIGTLRGRLAARDFAPIAVAIYHELLLYAEDSGAAFARVADRALPILVSAMQADEWSDRERAATILALYPGQKLAAAALAAWPAQSHLWNPDMIWTLARTRDPSAAAPLVAALDSDDGDVRRAAIYGIGYARITQAAPKLAASLQAPDLDDDEGVLTVAALSRLGGEFVARLEEVAANSGARDRTRLVALWAIGQAGDRFAAQALARRLHDDNADVSRFAGVVLRQFDGDAGIEALLGAAWATEASQRRSGERGLRAGRTADSLWTWDEPVLDRPERLVAQSFADTLALSSDGPMARAFVGRERIVVSLAGKRLRRSADAVVLSHLLAVVDEADEASSDSVRKVISGLRPELRRLARSPRAEIVLPAALLLPVASNDADIEVVVSAAAAVGGNGGATVIERLERYRWESVRSVVLERLRATEPRQRAAALRVLTRHGEQVAEPEFAQLARTLLHDPDPTVQLAAIETLGALRAVDSLASLEALFEHAALPQQKAIRRALERMDDEGARAAVMRLAIQPTRPPCEGNPDDLSDLLRDACVGGLDIPEF